MNLPVKHLLILGCGYVGQHLAQACLQQGIAVTGTTRSHERAAELKQAGIQTVVIDTVEGVPESLLVSVDAVLDSIPLSRHEQGVSAEQIVWLPQLVAKMSGVKWAGYLSTTGVYGDAGGAWVDETHLCQPSSPRGSQRDRKSVV